MELSADLLKRFVQVTNDKEPKKKETTVYGTVVKNGESTYVKLDGSSNTLTPAFLGVCADNNDRVIVNIKNHSATITNNLTSPPKTGIYSEILNENFNIITGRIASIEMITSKAITTDTLSAALVDAGYISAEEIHSEYIRADELVSKIATIDSLTANDAFIKNIQTVAIDADYIKSAVANVGYLTADSAVITSLQTDKLNTSELNAKVADLGYLTADSAVITSLQTDKLNAKDLNAEVAKLGYLTADSATITGKLNANELNAKVAELGYLTANNAVITNLQANKLDANQLSAEVAKLGYLDAKMANIDFANLNKANIGQLFANVGLISSATITDGHVTGYLDSVEVNANKITAGTLAVDRLLIKDSSGNYKMATYDSSGNLVTTTVNGSVITNRTITADHLVAGTITANEINMTNLVGNSAFINAINTNSVVVSASNNASSALNTVNDMEIGGRNLYLGTKDFSGEWGAIIYWNRLQETYNGFTVMSRTGGWCGLFQNFYGVVGETYTFSGYVKKTGGNTYVFVNNGSGKCSPDSAVIGTAVNVWEHFSFTTTVTQTGTLPFRVENSSSTETTYVCGLKLEKGNKATDWTPAPEDTEESINNVNTKAQGIIDNIYTPNTTTINGGKITTGSIKAAQIDVNDLFAQNITASGTINGATLKGATITANKLSLSETTTHDGTYNSVFNLNSNSDNTSLRYELQSKSNNKMLYFSNIKQGYDSTNYSGYVKLEGGSSQTGGSLIVRSGGVFVNNLNSSGSVTSSGNIYESGTALSNKYAPISHSHDYLPLSGGTITGSIYTSGNIRIGQSGGYNLYLGSASNAGWLIMQDMMSQASTCGWKLHQSGSMEILNNLTVGTIAGQSTYTIGVSGSLNATTIYENGTALSNKYAPISHGHDYLPLSGGTLNGQIHFNSNSLPSFDGSIPFLVGIEAFGNGGTLKWKSASDVSVGYATSAGSASTATKATQDGNGNVIASTYIPNFGSNPTYGNGSGLTQPGGAAALSIRTTTGASDVGIFYLSQDNCYIANSSDDAYTFGVFDTDLTKNMADVDAASFVVLSNGGGAKIRGQEVIHSGNIGDQSVNYANSAGSAPASDVYSWAKQSTKPSYALNEITGSSDIFKVVTYSYNSVSVASGSSATVTPSRTNIPSGYTAVAVYTVNSGGGRIYPRAHSADGTIVLVNESSAATVTPTMKVLCVKSTCVG